MARRDRKRNPARNLKQNRRFLVVVEGAVTEREYIEAVKRSRQMRCVEVRIEHEHTDPIGIVNEAKKIQNSAKRTDPFDEVWCVLDAEAKLTQAARHGLAAALDSADQARISCAVSNPCFEIWLLWHQSDQSAWVDSRAVQHRCAEIGITQNGRGKHIHDPDYLIAECFQAAKERAIRMEQSHDRNGNINPEDRNPSSGVYQLIDTICAAFPPRE